MNLTEEELATLLSDHRADVMSYDAYYIEGCEGCLWRPSDDADKRWDEYYKHLALLVLEVEEEAAEDKEWVENIYRIVPMDECTVIYFTDGTSLCSHPMTDISAEDWSNVVNMRTG